MTRGHATDVPVLREVLHQFPDAPYLGVIGSNVKGIKIRNEMKAEGFDPERVVRIRSPMGLDLGNNDPAEIAISIAAELIQVRGRN
jgi:xanthine dehydrogenase accessory factor